jgi:hypothetical protein
MDSLQLRKLSLENFCICHDPHAALWLMWVDWQMLRSARFTCPSFAILLGNRLANLRSLELHEILPGFALAQCRGPSASSEVRNSLSSCTQLIHLSLRNCSTIVNDFLLQHVGALLKKLCMLRTKDGTGRSSGMPSRSRRYSPSASTVQSYLIWRSTLIMNQDG